MKQTPYQLKWSYFLGMLLLGTFFSSLAPLSSSAAEIAGLSESIKASGFETTEQARGALENLPPEQRREALGRAKSLSPTQREEALEKLFRKEQDQKTKVPSKKKRGKSDPKKADTKKENDKPNLESGTRQAIHDLFPAGLTLFGHDLFVLTPKSFIPDTNIPIPENYRLGPGDSVLVQLSGKTFQQHTMTIDREGILTFPGIGPLPVTGMRFDGLKEMFRERVQKQMLGTEVARVTLGALRSLQVFILGDVPQPGSYTVNSLTTATNAIFSSGGIKPIGSLRTIQVKRRGETIVTLDLYDLLLRGDQSDDIRLQSGDVIFVPPIGTVVAVTGQVKRPSIYETLEERTVEEAITLAGGLLPNADPAHVKIERFQSQKKRVLLDLDLTQPKQLRSRIQSGDAIHTPSIPKAKTNIVTLTGAVANPGEYQWRKSVHLTDIVLFPKLLPQVDLSYAVVTRLDTKTGRLLPLTLNLGRAIEDPSSPDNIALKPGDVIQIFGLREDRANSVQTLINHLQGQARFDHRGQVVSIAGHVRFPGSYPFSPGMGIKDLLHAAGDIKVGADMAYALVARFNEQGEVQPFSIRLSKILDTKNTGEELPLQPMDQILIFQTNTDPSRKELLEPLLNKLNQQGGSSSPTRVVQINGSVRHPGTYPLEPQMHIRDLIRASGHLKEPAYVLDAELSRFSIVQGEFREINHHKVLLEKIIQGDTSADFLLHPHDALTIKRIPQWASSKTIKLVGEFRFPGTYPIKPGETLLQVIERAGGLTPYAYPKGSIFLRKNLEKRERREIETLANRLEIELAGRDLQSAGKEDRATSSLLLSLIRRLRSTTPQGRLSVDLPSMMASASKGMTYNKIVLQNEDHLFIPQEINEITVLGEIFHPTSHQYSPENSLENYINLSGGYSQMADQEHIYVVKANGQVLSNTPSTSLFGTAWLTGGNNGIPLAPGDTIVVPMQVNQIAPMVLWKDITQILYNIAVTSATLKTVGAF